MNGTNVSAPRDSDHLLSIVEASVPSLLVDEVFPSICNVRECKIVEHDERVVRGVAFSDLCVQERSFSLVVAIYEYHCPFQGLIRGFFGEGGDCGGRVARYEMDVFLNVCASQSIDNCQ